LRRLSIFHKPFCPGRRPEANPDTSSLARTYLSFVRDSQYISKTETLNSGSKHTKQTSYLMLYHVSCVRASSHINFPKKMKHSNWVIRHGRERHSMNAYKSTPCSSSTNLPCQPRFIPSQASYLSEHTDDLASWYVVPNFRIPPHLPLNTPHNDHHSTSLEFTSVSCSAEEPRVYTGHLHYHNLGCMVLE